MASIIKVDNVQNQPGTNIVNKCGTTTTIGAGAGETINVCAATVNIGRCGGTVALAAGATQTGFGRTGTVDWITTPKVTGDSPITAVSGNGYFLNTTAGTITVNLPAGSAGDIISMADYAATWQTNNVTVSPNGTDKIGGVNLAVTLNTEGQSVTLVYADSTQGWLNTMDSTSNVRGVSFVAATGGSPACGITCGDYKTHIFTGPGTFCVSAISNVVSNNSIDYFVVAGGGGSKSIPTSTAGGGGAGGIRLSNVVGCIPAPSMSPLASVTGIPVSVQPYAIVIGAGATNPCSPSQAPNGADSSFSTIISAGGGGASAGLSGPGVAGGSGGGGANGPGPTSGYPGGAGNTPPVSPSQGNTGGAGYDGLTASNNSGGGGGGGAAGTCAYAYNGGPGGVGTYLADAFIGPTAPSYGTPGPIGGRYFAGGGGGSADGCTAKATGGAGGGGAAGNPGAGGNGTVNTGGGSGGGGPTGGGSGIIMIRYKFQ